MSPSTSRIWRVSRRSRLTEDECSFIRHRIVQFGFRNFPVNEGEMLGLLIGPDQRVFPKVRASAGDDREYRYMEAYAQNPLPEHRAEDIFYFSFVSSGSEIKLMSKLFATTGRGADKRLKGARDFGSSAEYRRFLRSGGFGRTFLFKFPKMIKVLIESGNGSFLGSLANWLFDRFESSLLKPDSGARSRLFGAEKKIELSRLITETLKGLSAKNQRKVEARGYAEMGRRRVWGNHVFRTRVFR